MGRIDQGSSDPSQIGTETSIMVLLVDDQLIVGEAISRALAKQPDIAFHFCNDPSDALSLAKELKPTVILQDLVMPRTDGLDLVRRYRAEPATRTIPIIVLSVKEEPKVKSDAFAAGANDYIVKLPDEIELIARIRYHSSAYLTQLQRDDAYRALRESQRQLIERNLELQRLTNVDSLTGLKNRRYFDEYLDAEWKRAIRGGTPLSMLMVDVDCFKEYNDSYGHLAGDEVLKAIANTIQACCGRSSDLVARFGGEEFALILPETPQTGARHVAHKVRGEIEALHVAHMSSKIGRHVTVSVGCATTIPQRGDMPDRLVETADKALYRAKNAGRNRVVIAASDG